MVISFTHVEYSKAIEMVLTTELHIKVVEALDCLFGAKDSGY